VHHVAKAMGLDGRIGKYFLHAGPGYGGSCFPKDTKALVNIGNEFSVNMSVVQAVVTANEDQKQYMVQKIEQKMGEVSSKVFGILGLAFKPQTDDMREAPSIAIIRKLLDRGAKVRAYDPVAMENASQDAFPDIVARKSGDPLQDTPNAACTLIYCQDEYDAVTGVDAVILITEWNEFRSLNLAKSQGFNAGKLLL